MKDFRISNALSPRNVDAAATLLLQPRLWVPDQRRDYPGHMEWRDKALSEIEATKKIAMVAFWGSDEVGVCIYQRDPKEPTRVEIRNLSVESSARGRGLAPFVLRQVECEAPIDFPGATVLVADVKRTNVNMTHFALRQGFAVQDITSLDSTFAHNGIEDVVLSKAMTAPA